MFSLPIRDSIAVLLGQSNILRLGYRFKFDVREFVSEQFYFAFTRFGPPALDFNKCSIGKLEVGSVCFSLSHFECFRFILPSYTKVVKDASIIRLPG